ncbi:hypothetical protein B5M09_007936 [Aphanomyces astaci]|uniref:Uncharacterized protein n=1 Tax=Aphanomyces astaci TaxID=112090 RepID=A0A425D930_APHAT|nr:hypothetical protein B5M09_007936 [Aphanomyces astaci]
MIHLHCTQTSHSIHVTQTVVDLSDDSTYGPAIDTFVEEAQAAASVDRVVVFHNAGSLGQVGRIAEVASPQVIRRHMELNVNSCMAPKLRQLKGTYVDVNVSAQLCVSHVFGPTLVSGSHVDYYDIYQG